MDAEQEHALVIRYVFCCGPDDKINEFVVKLDPISLHVLTSQERIPPEWARLAHVDCPHCPLNKQTEEWCPVAVNIFDLVERFTGGVSCDEVHLRIETERRSYVKLVSLQSSVSSLLGIYMAASGCPYFEKLKPLVRYHLPFASPEETTYRMVTMYLMAQYLRLRKGQSADWQLEHLSEIFKNIMQVNRTLCAKLRRVIQDDAIVNALVKLNSQVDFISFRLENNLLWEIEQNFQAYLDPEPEVDPAATQE